MEDKSAAPEVKQQVEEDWRHQLLFDGHTKINPQNDWEKNLFFGIKKKVNESQKLVNLFKHNKITWKSRQNDCEFSRSVLCLSFFPCTKQNAEEAAGSWFDEAEYVI